MTLRDDKSKIFEEKCDGEGTGIRNIPKFFSDCSIYNGGLMIDKDVMMIVRHDNRYPEYHSTVLYNDKIPVVTNQTTSILIKNTTTLKIIPIDVLKIFCRTLYGKASYKLPYMSFDSCFVPLEGISGKNSDYINLTFVDTIYKYDKFNTVVKLLNGFEVHLPMKYSNVLELVDKYLKLYAIYYSCDNIHQVDIFSKWKGNYYLEREPFIELDVKKALKKDAEHIKRKANFKHYSTLADKHEITNDLYG